MLSAHKVAVIGGGFTGTLLALKLSAARPDWTVILIESHGTAGRGLAYGACEPQHLLNVPVGRMEVGLEPSFATWLAGRAGFLRDALKESGGVLLDAFVPRQSFGDYMELQLADARLAGRVQCLRGTAVRIDQNPRQVVLADSTVVSVDDVVLATGNLPPRLPFAARPSERIVIDPWRPGALDRIGSQDSLLLLGTGLTMVDMLLNLRARGHKGRIRAVSRNGRMPRVHRAGGSWPTFLAPDVSPRQALRSIRRAVEDAEARGIPWQRVFDAVRPAVGALWQGWGLGQRAQFLRHLRSLWDVHRHRMAERIAAVVDERLASGLLTVTAGRVLAVDEHTDGVTAMIRPRGEKALTVEADTIINCTGPAIDLRKVQHPLLRDLQQQGLVRSDPLGLGLDTDDCAAIGDNHAASGWLFVLGPLTRPAFWEITAVPEINAQVDRLVGRLAQETSQRSLTSVFLDIGSGI